MPDDIISLQYESATVRLQMRYDKQLIVSHLYSTKPRQGHARRLMELVCAYADVQAKYAILRAGQYGLATGMNNDQLVRFYESFGFALVSGSTPEKLIMRRDSQDLHGL